jgi:hypothetical protein
MAEPMPNGYGTLTSPQLVLQPGIPIAALGPPAPESGNISAAAVAMIATPEMEMLVFAIDC